MKKTVIAAAALILMTALTACGESAATAQNSEAETTTSAAETTTSQAETTTTASETTTETTTETTADAENTEQTTTTTAAADSAADADTAELIDTAYNLLMQYSDIDCLAASSIDADLNDSFTEGDYATYSHVTDARFQSVSDLKAMVAETLTGELEQNVDAEMFEGHYPIYIDKDGKLYVLNGGRGSGFDFLKDTLVIKEVTADGFTATVDKKLPGDMIEHDSLTVSSVDGKYRLSSVKAN